MKRVLAAVLFVPGVALAGPALPEIEVDCGRQGDVTLLVEYTPPHDEGGETPEPFTHASWHVRWNVPPPPTPTAPPPDGAVELSNSTITAEPGDPLERSPWHIAAAAPNLECGVVWEHNEKKQLTFTRGFTLPPETDPGTFKDPAATIVGGDDFNGDGTVDLLLFRPGAGNAAFTVWASSRYGRNAQPLVAESVLGGSTAEVALPVGVFRMEGDAAPRLVWRSSTGASVSYGRLLWDGSEVSYESAGLLSWVPKNGVRLVAIADYDYDGRSDLMWQDEADESLTVCRGPSFTTCDSMNPPRLLHPYWGERLDWHIRASN